MTSSSSVISICNRSLLSVGARAQVSSLSEGSTESNALSVLYQPTFESLARSAPWNCLKKQATLTLLAAAQGTPENPNGTTLPLPPQPYLYAYALPSDCLQMRFIMPIFPNNTGNGTIPLTTASVVADSTYGVYGQIPFYVSYSTDSANNPINIILTNQTQAQAVYTVNQSSPVIWDSLFESAMVASLAVYLVPALSLNDKLMQMSVKMAEGIISQARVRDGDEGVTSQNREASWMRARNTGGSLGWNGWTGNVYGCWDNMAWPGG